MYAVADLPRFVDDLLACHDSDLLNARASDHLYLARYSMIFA
jgi:hypothetical protein